VRADRAESEAHPETTTVSCWLRGGPLYYSALRQAGSRAAASGHSKALARHRKPDHPGVAQQSSVEQFFAAQPRGESALTRR